jgi:Ser/Thr protein kinase RdoA (MazF antagonist)
MSSVDLIKAPAWRGLTPGLPETIELPAAEAARIRDAVGLSGRLAGLAMGGGEIVHYRIDPPSGPPLFLKLAQPSQREVVERAEGIARWLTERGVSVAAPLPGYPRPLADGRVAVVTAFVDGRRVRGDAADLAGLGRCVGHLHRALAAHPDRAGWSRATAVRLDALDNVRADLAAGRLRRGPEPEQLRELAADKTLTFHPKGAPAEPLHGDLNPGNVLVDLKSAEPILLDFEDVFHSVLPSIFELLLIVERFILVPVDADGEAEALARTLLESYRGVAGPTVCVPGQSPSNSLRSLALRSLCVLALGERSGIATANDEWTKFFTLERHARRRATLVDQIFADDPR